jgi:hypothetical protein
MRGVGTSSWPKLGTATWPLRGSKVDWGVAPTRLCTRRRRPGDDFQRLTIEVVKGLKFGGAGATNREDRGRNRVRLRASDGGQVVGHAMAESFRGPTGRSLSAHGHVRKRAAALFEWSGLMMPYDTVSMAEQRNSWGSS